MNYTAIHETAPNGTTIGGTVRLQGGEDEPFDERPWFAQATVAHTPMAHAFFPTRREADEWLRRMVGAYREVHG